MTVIQKTITPIDGSVYIERPLASWGEVAAGLAKARTAQAAWKHTPLADLQKILANTVDVFAAKKETIAEDINLQIGRTLGQAASEVRGQPERHTRSALARTPI